MKLTAVFDIGKTNKKFFLFDENYQEISKEYSRFEEVHDEDGYPSDNLPAIEAWLKMQFGRVLRDRKHQVEAVNFSTYGASLVHLDRHGRVLTPLYNYTKPYPPEVLDSFYQKHGDPVAIALETASPPSGMLNSGLQLFWLKYRQPKVFHQIRYSLHFPQYLSYLFTGIPVSDYTSIGCHTGLWHFEKGDYHDWVYAEGIDKILPPIVSADTSINVDYGHKRMRVGVGIHDSSAALLPYLKCDSKPFLLISTGTWSISLNPFSSENLTQEELRNDCLQYLRVDGKPVKAARLFLGNEYSLQVNRLLTHFDKDKDYHRSVRFDPDLYRRLVADKTPRFHFESLPTKGSSPEYTQLENFATFEEAFHRLMIELIDYQLHSTRLTIGTSTIKKIYVDGGFADNDIFVKLLAHHFPAIKLRTTRSPLGSALGAALIVADPQKMPKKFLKTNYQLRKHNPLTF